MTSLSTRIHLAALILCSLAYAQDAAKIATPGYWSAVGVTAAMATADAYTSVNPSFHKPDGCAFESNAWLYGRMPQKAPARAITVMAGEVVLASVAAYEIKRYGNRHGRKLARWWFVPLVWTAGMHASGAVQNYINC